MQSLIRSAGFLTTVAALVAAPAQIPAEVVPDDAGEFHISQIEYDARLDESGAHFTVTLEAESFDRRKKTLPLFEGDVAVLPVKLPTGLSLEREGRQYRLSADRKGQWRLELEVVSKVTRAEPWNQTRFTGPTATIAALRAQAQEPGMEVELMSASALDRAHHDPARVDALLGAEREIALRWQSRAAEAARGPLITCETEAEARISPSVIKVDTQFRFDVLQGEMAAFAVRLPADQALTRVEGAQIRDWRLTPGEAGGQVLQVDLLKPADRSYTLRLTTEQALESLPCTGAIDLPCPQQAEREAGSLILFREDTTVETTDLTGLRQVDPPADAIRAYRFDGRPLSLGIRLEPLEPELTVSDRVRVAIEDSRMLLVHAFEVSVDKAGLYALELAPLGSRVVTGVNGEGIQDWRIADGRLGVSYSNRVIGKRTLEVRLEEPHAAFPAAMVVRPLQVVGATRQHDTVGAASAPGIGIKTAEMQGLREIPASQLPGRRDELLAYVAQESDWTLRLATEKQAARVLADVFNLVTIGDGLIGGSASIRFLIVNQGVQEFRLSLPARWKNVDFTGPGIRRRELVGGDGLSPDASEETQAVVWAVALQEKVWGAYTLVVTYDEPFDPHQAVLSLGGIHALSVERETGSIAIASAANLELRELAAPAPLRRIDDQELGAADRALISRPVLLAYRYETAAPPYALSIEVTRFDELPVLSAVADRTQLTTVLTERGQALTQVSYMVKNNDKQFQELILPEGATLWSSFVDGKPVKAEQQQDRILVPLPRGRDRDQAFGIEIVYAQSLEPLTRVAPMSLELMAPRTDIQTTFAEWEIFVPPTHHLRHFRGTMLAPPGTTYGFHDAWRECRDQYRSLRGPSGPMLVVMGLVVLMVAVGWGAWRAGGPGLLSAVGLVCLILVVAGMFMPALAKAKGKSQLISAINNLRQIGLAAKIYANDNGDVFPASFGQMRHELGTDKVLIDPRTGQRFVYVGAGGSDEYPSEILAYSGSVSGHRIVLLADGSVTHLAEHEFQQRLVESQTRQRQAQSDLAQIAAAPVSPSPAQQAQPASDVQTAQFLANVTPSSTLPPAAAAVPGLPAAAADFGALSSAAAGLNPIRIVIPRTGKRFSFTKILNVRDEPPRVEAWAVSTRVWQTGRALVQFLVMLLGLAGLAWERRRSPARSLALAAASALAIGGVISVLLTARWLGAVLALGLPLLVLAALILLIISWRRRHPHKTEEKSDSPVNPITEGSGGPAPATPLIGLLLLGSFLLGGRTSATADDQAATDCHEPVVILSAIYQGEVDAHAARIDATFELSPSDTDRTWTLFGDDVAIEAFSASSDAVRLSRRPGGWEVAVPGKRRTRLEARFLAKLAGDVTQRRLTFQIPPALSSQLGLNLAEPDAVVECPSAVSCQTERNGPLTRVTAILGAADRVDLAWTPRIKAATEMVATVFCDSTTRARFTGRTLSLCTRYEYQVTQGELRQLRVRLPAQQRLLRVEGAHLRTWHTTPAGAGDAETPGSILTVELVKGMSPDYALTLETEADLGPLPLAVALQVPEALEVRRHTGAVGLAWAEELSLSLETSRGLQKIDPDAVKAWPESDSAPAMAYRFLRPDFDLSARLEPRQPVVEATVCDRVRLGTEQIRLSSRAEFVVKHIGVFGLSFLIPEGYRLETVQGEHVAQWNETTESGQRRLEVGFRQRILGPYTLTLTFIRPLENLAPEVDIPRLIPRPVAKLHGFVVVSTEPGLQARTAVVQGFSEVPVASVPGGGAGLAYQWLPRDPAAEDAPVQLRVAVEAVEAWVRAELIQGLTLTDTLVSGRSLIRYEIQNAPVKQFALRVPAHFQNVEIRGDHVRRIDREGEQWRVQLQSKVAGIRFLEVTWERPWQVAPDGVETALEVEGVEALEVERETGWIAITAPGSLRITPRQAGPELLRIDTQELPEWDSGRNAGAVLAYRYLRPGYAFALAGQRFAQAEVLQALADHVRLSTVIADDGQWMTRMQVEVRNNSRQFLTLALPDEAEVWSAFVSGQPVRPVLRNGDILVPLEQSARPDEIVTVELTYVSASSFPSGRGRVRLASPGLDVPVRTAAWELYLPGDYDYGGFGGSMIHEKDLATVQGTFSWGEYSIAETQRQHETQAEASALVSELKRSLSSGQLDQAAKAYGKAKRSGGIKDSQAFKQAEQELRRAQSSNLLNAQQTVIYNNTGFLNLESTQEQQPLAANFDAATAEQQWVKLQQAQEIDTAAARPLRLSLPTRGLRHSFSQVLQTQIGQPLSIEFNAAHLRRGTWLTHGAWASALFLAWWALIHRLTRSRTAESVGR